MRVLNIADWKAKTHVIVAVQASVEEGCCDDAASWEGAQEYRDVTVGMLRRFFRMSLDVGRVPSFLGGELFRARVTAYRVHSFEDVVIFLYDMERCLARLDPVARRLIAMIVFEEHSQAETSRLLGISRRQVTQQFDDAVDELSRILLDCDLLLPREKQAEEGKSLGLPPKKRAVREGCQVVQFVEMSVTDQKRSS